MAVITGLFTGILVWVASSCEWLRKQRKYAIIISAIVAAMLTPTTDAISMMLMFVPILVFYELGILVAWMFGKKKAPEEPEEETFE